MPFKIDYSQLVEAYESKGNIFLKYVCLRLFEEMNSGNVAINILVEQKELQKRFSFITLTSSEKMQIELFHML